MDPKNIAINSNGASDNPPDIADDKNSHLKEHTTTACQDDKFDLQLKRAVSRYVTVEIPVALTCFTYQMLVTMKTEYIHDRLAAKHNHSLVHNSSASMCGANLTSNGSDTIEDEIQAETATWLLYLGIAYSIPGIFMAILLSSLSDRLGRKPAMCLVILGNCCASSIYLAIVYFQTPIEYLLLGDFVMGMCGGQALLLSAAVAYIADVTSERSRMSRIIILETIFFVGMGAGQISLGTALQYSTDHSFQKYMVPIWMALGCSMAAFVYTVLPGVLIETVNRRTEGKSIKVKSLVSGFLDLIRVNTDHRRLKVLMYTVVMICMTITSKCQSQLTVVYSLGDPFCFNPLMVSILNIVGLSSQSFGMIMSGLFLGRIMSEDWIIQMSLWNTGLVFLIIALAKISLLLFIATGIGVFNAICFPVMRSQLSKIAGEHERGLMLAFVGCMDSIGTLLMPVIANNIYSATVSFYPPLVFFFLVAFHIIPSTSIGILQCTNRRTQKYHVINSEDQ